MGAVIGVVAAVIALVGLAVALGNVGYLYMLRNAAKDRGLSGGATMEYVNGRWKTAGGITLVALLGLLMTNGGALADILGLLVAGGAGLAAKKSLDSTRAQFPNR